MSTYTACCAICFVDEPDSEFKAAPHHYEQLRDALDHGDKGWVELESASPGCKGLFRLEDIKSLCLCTSEYYEAKAAEALTR